MEYISELYLSLASLLFLSLLFFFFFFFEIFSTYCKVSLIDSPVALIALLSDLLPISFQKDENLHVFNELRIILTHSNGPKIEDFEILCSVISYELSVKRIFTH